MKKQTDEIESVLNSLEGIKAADPGPYFYSRLMAKHQAVGTQVAVPVFWKAVIAVVLLVNLFSFYLVSTTSVTSDSSSDAIDLLATDYFGTNNQETSIVEYNF